ncbi:14108_t:CDS:10 [Ambispora leptoticha]|uniref:14108_t:CDS:1 n=1 Tax=Ambispora leptoticha TaxID=144679 RepID=A0A9N9BBB6_9GLOM|nr:14108_t:CDS:10 [Ambispora leptoticha]
MVKEEAKYVNKFVLPKFQKTSIYEGKHVHEAKKVHECDDTCPNDLFEHIKENSKTVHGNMVLTTFTCDEEEFEFEGHQLTAGDRGDFVLCHKVDIVISIIAKIQMLVPQVEKKGGVEHIKANISPDPSREKDYISHRVFWERTKFRDPYSREDREDFKKCDHECIDEKHHKELFHIGLNPSSNPPGNVGYISTDGHHFTCENPTSNVGDFHIVFVVDRSGSMSIRDCRPRGDKTQTARLLLSHNNRLAIDRDITSLILFDYVAIVVFENQSLTDSDELLNKMKNFTPQGDNYYHEGIKKADEIIQKTNIIIFFSDEEYHPPEPELRSLCQKEADKGTLYICIQLCSPVVLLILLMANRFKKWRMSQQDIYLDLLAEMP